MQPKSLLFSALFFAALLIFTGCSSQPTVEPVAEPIALTVACPAGPAADVVRSYCKAWQARNNAVVEVKEYGADGPEETGADVWVIAPAELGRWADSGRLRPVPESLQRKDDAFGWDGLLALYRAHLLMWDGTAFALPVLGEAPIFCYRSDLVKAPTTWKDVETTAANVHKHLPPGMSAGLPPLPPDDEGLGRLFFAIAAGYAHEGIADITSRNTDEAFSFHYDLKTGAPRIDGPGFVHALVLLQRMQAYRPKARESTVEAFRSGTGVFCLTDAAQVFRLQQHDSKVRDRFAIVRVPGAEACFGHAARAGDRPAPGFNWVPYLGGAARIGVVPVKAKHPDAAFSLLAELGGKDVSRQVVTTPRIQPPRGGGVLRSDQFDRYARWDAFGLTPSQTEALKLVVQQTLEHQDVANPVFPLSIPDEHAHRTILIQALRKALNDPTTDPAATLAEVARGWRELDRKNPKHREEYRASLGLR